MEGDHDIGQLYALLPISMGKGACFLDSIEIGKIRGPLSLLHDDEELCAVSHRYQVFPDTHHIDGTNMMGHHIIGCIGQQENLGSIRKIIMTEILGKKRLDDDLFSIALPGKAYRISNTMHSFTKGFQGNECAPGIFLVQIFFNPLLLDICWQMTTSGPGFPAGEVCLLFFCEGVDGYIHGL
jgi:hypothetical protein